MYCIAKRSQFTVTDNRHFSRFTFVRVVHQEIRYLKTEGKESKLSFGMQHTPVSFFKEREREFPVHLFQFLFQFELY